MHWGIYHNLSVRCGLPPTPVWMWDALCIGHPFTSFLSTIRMNFTSSCPVSLYTGGSSCVSPYYLTFEQIAWMDYIRLQRWSHSYKAKQIMLHWKQSRSAKTHLSRTFNPGTISETNTRTEKNRKKLIEEKMIYITEMGTINI